MATFTITDTIPIWISFQYEVKADSPEEALEAYRDGEWTRELGYDANDFETIEGVEQQISIEATT